MKSFKITDPEVVCILTANPNKSPTQMLRELYGMPEKKSNKPRRKANRLVRAWRALLGGG